MCLQVAHVVRTGKDFHENTIFLLFRGVVKGEPSNAFTVIASILLLHDGKIPRHSNSSVVSVILKRQKSPDIEVKKQSFCSVQKISSSITIIWMELIKETNFSNTLQVFS